MLIEISIHALREEGDRRKTANLRGGIISIHALREEGDVKDIMSTIGCSEFLSTPSVRRATRHPRRLGEQRRDFYPRPP